MEIAELGNFSNEIIKLAGKFIPDDIGKRMADRMSATERATVIGPDAAKVIWELMKVPGIKPASSRDLKDSVNLLNLNDGTVISWYVNPVGCEHIFLSNVKKECIFGGWVGWIHKKELKDTVEKLGKIYAV
jgi:hypothetical protein